MARKSWAFRQKRQLGRFGGKATKALVDPSVKAVAQAAWSGVKYLRTLVNSEAFVFDTNGTSTATLAGNIINLHNIAQGDNDGNRTGNSILVNSLLHRELFTLNVLSVAESVRRIVFMDTQQIGDTAPAVTDILESASYLAPLNHLTKGRFKVLQDMSFVLSAQGGPYKVIKKFRKMQHHIRYNGAAGTDIQKGGLYVLWISSAGANPPSIAYNIRTTYHDN